MTLEGSPAPAQRVVLFGSYAPSLTIFRGPLIAEMARRGHKVFALAPDIDEETARAVRALGAEPVSVPLGRTSLDPFEARRSAKALKALLREIRPDVLIAYTIKPVILGARAARSAGVRFVPMITGLGYAFLGGNHPKRRLIRALAVRMYRRALAAAQVVLFQNEDDRADFRRMRILAPSARSEIVNGSGVDVDHYAAQPLPEQPSFLMIARLLRDKGVREYGAAALRLKRERPDVRVSLAGWTDESPDTISAAELDAMIEGGVEFLGKLEDVRPALGACSVYVLPSYREGTPRSVLEAMAVGRAIVTTDAPGCRATVMHGENGLLVPPADADALFEAMLKLADDAGERRRMGEASRRIAETKYDVGRVNAELLSHAGL